MAPVTMKYKGAEYWRADKAAADCELSVAAERDRIRREISELLDLQDLYEPDQYEGEYRLGLLNGSERAVDAIRRGLRRICQERKGS